MSGASIAEEVNAALASLASEVGGGAFPITLTRPATRTSPSDPVGAPETFDMVGNVEMYSRGQVDGTLIQQGDRRVMLSATGERPTTADTLTMGGTQYRIIDVMEEAPQGVPLFYIVQARV